MAELAQVNVALPREPVEAQLLADFVAALDPVNARADRAPGFRWRLQDEGGNATTISISLDSRMIVNMSVWADLEALGGWVYGDREHLAVMRRRREWFEKLEVFMALWWVPEGHRPTVAEAEQRLAHLRANGPTPWAFTFRQPFAAGGFECRCGLATSAPPERGGSTAPGEPERAALGVAADGPRLAGMNHAAAV